MTDTIPDYVGREAVRLLNEERVTPTYRWPADQDVPALKAIAKLLMNPPAPMIDLDEEAAKRVIAAWLDGDERFAAATEQMRKEFAARKEAGEAGRS